MKVYSVMPNSYSKSSSNAEVVTGALPGMAIIDSLNKTWSLW